MRTLITLSFLVLVGCGDGHTTFEIGDTKFKLVDEAEAWIDLPEVMEKMWEVEGTPEDLFDTTVTIIPGSRDLRNENDYDANCFFWHNDQDITIRNIWEYAFESCLGHEFAHRWMFTTGEDTRTGSVTHDHPDFIKRKDELALKGCQGGWPVKDRDCPKRKYK